MDYAVNVTAAGTYTVDFRVASPYNNTQLQLKSGSTVLATVTVPATGSYQTWQTVSVPVTLSAGAQTLRVECLTNGFNFNYMDFRA
ncbi:Carbohydrate binding module (family 6) [compost metagenome]